MFENGTILKQIIFHWLAKAVTLRGNVPTGARRLVYKFTKTGAASGQDAPSTANNVTVYT